MVLHQLATGMVEQFSGQLPPSRAGSYPESATIDPSGDSQELARLARLVEAQ